MADQDSYPKLLDDTARLLSFHQTLGIDHYPTTDGLRKFLAKPKAVPRPRPVQQTTAKKTFRSATQAAPIAQPAQPVGNLSEIKTELGDCKRCTLNETRTHLMFGTGGPEANLMIIAEWPSRQDDLSGEMFSGPEGEMLGKMLSHVLKLERQQVYLTTLVKCAPPTTKPPGPEQIKTCLPFLQSQIMAVAPKVICTMGPLAAQTLLKASSPFVRLRGRFHDYHGIPLLPTYHPSFLLKNPEMKKATLVDLQLVAKKLNE